jgi:membrane-bound metal-dependent hydrolase YbcI (DUF457 family)
MFFGILILSFYVIPNNMANNNNDFVWAYGKYMFKMGCIIIFLDFLRIFKMQLPYPISRIGTHLPNQLFFQKMWFGIC